VIPAAPQNADNPPSQSASPGGRKAMLQWNTRLIALIVFVVLLAALVGDLESAGGFQFGW